MSDRDDTTTRAVTLARNSERRVRRQATLGALVLVAMVVVAVFFVMRSGESRAEELERAVRLGEEVDDLEHDAMSAWSAYWEGRNQSTYSEMREIADAQVFPLMDDALDILDAQTWSLPETEHMWEVARECVARSKFTIERNVTKDESLTQEENSAEQEKAWSDRGTYCDDLSDLLGDLEDELELERGAG